MNEPVAIQRNGTHLVVTICADIVVDYVHLEERNLRQDLPWSTFWEFTDTMNLRTGDVLSTNPSATAPIDEEVRKDPHMDEGDQIRVLIAHPGPGTPHVSVDSIFYVTEERLIEDAWLHPDGSTTEEPCL